MSSKQVKKTEPVKKEVSYKILTWVILGAALLFTVIFRLKMINLPLERDEGEFAYIATLILDGESPFSAYNYKIPGVSFLYSFFMIFFGKGIAGVKAGLMVVSLLNVFLFYKVFSKYINALTGAAGALFFSVMISDFGVLGNSAHATHFVNLFVLLAFWFAVLWFDKPKLLYFFAGGAMCSLAFCMKQPAAVMFPFFGLLVLHSFRKGFVKQLKKVAIAVAAFIAGAAVPLLILALVVSIYNDWERFINWTFVYPRLYASMLTFGDGVEVFKMIFPMVVGAFTAWWLASVFGLVVLWRNKDLPKDKKQIVTAFAIFTFLTVVPGYYFRNHYFIVFLPAVALFAGYSISWLYNLSVKMMGKAGVAVATIVLVLAFLFPVQQRSKLYFSTRVDKVSREIYMGNPFADSKNIAEFIKQNTKEGDKMAVFGSEAQLYYYTGLRSATGYMFTYEMVKKMPHAEKMQLEMINEIDSVKPAIYVFSNVNTSWLVEPGSPDTIFKWMDESIRKDYMPIGVVDLIDNKSVFVKDTAVYTYKPVSRNVVWIFKRNANEKN